MLSGIPISCWAFSIALVASPRDAFGARVNDSVTTGNCPWWLTDSGAVLDSKCVKALSGTAAPFVLATAVGFAEPELGRADEEADGLGDPADPPVAVPAVTVPFVMEFEEEEPVDVAEGA